MWELLFKTLALYRVFVQKWSPIIVLDLELKSSFLNTQKAAFQAKRIGWSFGKRYLLIYFCRELAVKFHQTINKVVKDPQDKDMLFMHYRLLDSEDAPSSFKDLGRRFGMSYESVRLRLKRIKEEIRQSPKLTAELKQYFTAEVLDY